MMDAKSHIENLSATYKSIKADFDKANKAVSEVDRELSDKYHEIELSKSFNVVQGYKHAKEIQEILKKRRILKGEAARMNAIMGVIKSMQFEENLSQMGQRLTKSLKKHAEITGENV